MSDDRIWWPFAVKPPQDQTEQDKSEIEFFERATAMGCRAYVQDSDLGAISSKGRECRIVWRGNHRREVVFIDHGKALPKKLFTATKPTMAFREAADAALQWMREAAVPLAHRGTGAETTSVPASSQLPG